MQWLGRILVSSTRHFYPLVHMPHPLNQSLGSSSLKAAAGTYWSEALHDAYPWWMCTSTIWFAQCTEQGIPCAWWADSVLGSRTKGQRGNSYFPEGFPIYTKVCGTDTELSISAQPYVLGSQKVQHSNQCPPAFHEDSFLPVLSSALEEISHRIPQGSAWPWRAQWGLKHLLLPETAEV